MKSRLWVTPISKIYGWISSRPLTLLKQLYNDYFTNLSKPDFETKKKGFLLLFLSWRKFRAVLITGITNQRASGALEKFTSLPSLCSSPPQKKKMRVSSHRVAGKIRLVLSKRDKDE